MVNRISAERLAEMIDRDEPFTLIDTRPEESFEAWRVEGAHNVPYDPDEEFEEDDAARVEEAVEEAPVLTICAKGLSSSPFAMELEEHGYEDVRVVEGGMEGWSEVYEAVELPVGTDDFAIVQLQRRGTGCLGYVVCALDAGEAVVVDPTRHVDEYKVVAQELGCEITRVIDTHVHADHVSGGPQLAEDLDVPYHLGERASERGVEYDFEGLADGETIALGNLDLQAVFAPGHTDELIVLRIADEALLTADALFLDSVGRTELAFEDDPAEGAELLYETLHDRILSLSEELSVLPGHVTIQDDGTYAVGSPGEPLAADLGDLREGLELLGLERESFVSRLTDDLPEQPQNYETIVSINLGEESLPEAELAALEGGPNSCAA